MQSVELVLGAMMCLKAMGWLVVIGVFLMWLLALPYWGKYRNFA